MTEEEQLVDWAECVLDLDDYPLACLGDALWEKLKDCEELGVADVKNALVAVALAFCSDDPVDDSGSGVAE